MDTSLGAYVRVYKNVISFELCDQILLQLQQANWVREGFYDAPTNTTQYPSEVVFSTSDEIPSNPQLIDIVWKSLETYVLKDFNFPWLQGWSGFSAPKYNRYQETNGMQLHCDHIHTLFDGERRGIPVFTALSLLNDDFEGGEFVMFGDTVVKLNKGDVVVFPSNFLYPHKVNSVTKGVRYSAVCWSW